MGIAVRRTASMALAGLLVAGIAACGGDDSDDADEDSSGSGSSSAPAEEATGDGSEPDLDTFCEGFIALDEAFAAAPEDPADLEAYMADSVMPVAEETRDNVPEELAEPVGVMFEALDTVAATGDLAAFDDPEFTDAQPRSTGGWPARAATRR